MTSNDYKLTLHMVCSVDGIIAKPDNSVSWFETKDHYENGVEAQDQEESDRSIDCYVMGSKTYEHAMELSKEYGWVYGDKPTIVVTGRNLQDDRVNIEFFSGDLIALVNEKLKPVYKNVWVVGGSLLIRDFIRQNLADEIRMNILPIILGDGVPFFNQIRKEQALHLKDSIAYKNGMLELCYEIIR